MMILAKDKAGDNFENAMSSWEATEVYDPNAEPAEKGPRVKPMSRWNADESTPVELLACDIYVTRLLMAMEKTDNKNDSDKIRIQKPWKFSQWVSASVATTRTDCFARNLRHRNFSNKLFFKQFKQFRIGFFRI